MEADSFELTFLYLIVLVLVQFIHTERGSAGEDVFEPIRPPRVEPVSKMLVCPSSMFNIPFQVLPGFFFVCLSNAVIINVPPRRQ